MNKEKKSEDFYSFGNFVSDCNQENEMVVVENIQNGFKSKV